MRSTLEIIRMLNPHCDKTSTLVDKLDKQVMELAAQLDRLQRDPASYRRATGTRTHGESPVALPEI